MQVRANILRAVLIATLVIAMGASVSAQIDARSLMNAQRQGQQGLGANGLPGMTDPSQPGTGGQPTDPNANPTGGEQADTTKKKKPRKPLESYFFSDSIRALQNFQWHIDREYNTVKVEPIDTTLNV